jgi:hypothetical protein
MGRAASARRNAHYEDQAEDEQFAEIEAAHQAAGITMIGVPTELVPEIKAFIARRQRD